MQPGWTYVCRDIMFCGIFWDERASIVQWSLKGDLLVLRCGPITDVKAKGDKNADQDC